jgi:hypothetical protein
MTHIKDMTTPALAAGIGTAILTYTIFLMPIPFIANLTCCLWLTAAGATATYLLKKKTGQTTLKDGAATGALTGITYTITTATFLTLNIALLGTDTIQKTMQQEGAGITELAVGATITLAIILIIATTITTIGGILAAKILE